MNQNEPIIWELPLRIVSEANKQEHWTVSSRRHKQQQFFVRRLFSVNATMVQLPCTIKLIRLCVRLYDDDNLRTAFKWIRDEISECIFPEKRFKFINKKGKLQSVKGRADNSPLIKWEYDQEKAKRLGIRIEIYNERKKE